MEFMTLEEETKQIRDTFDLMDDDMMNDAFNNNSAKSVRTSSINLIKMNKEFLYKEFLYKVRDYIKSIKKNARVVPWVDNIYIENIKLSEEQRTEIKNIAKNMNQELKKKKKLPIKIESYHWNWIQ